MIYVIILLITLLLLLIGGFIFFKVRATLQDLKSENKTLVAMALKDANEYLVNSNTRSMQEILAPFKESMIEIKRRSEDMHTSQTKQVGELQGQLNHMLKAHTKLTEETNNLSSALRGKIKVQGFLGEGILKRVLESPGLKKGTSYLEQAAYNTEEGRKQPDYIIKLPEDRDIIIDAKLTLNSYLDYYNAENNTNKEEFLTQMGRAFKKHIEVLATKEYYGIESINSVKAVLIFIPVESIFLLLVDNFPELFLEAGKKNIYIVTATSLMPLLQVVENMWKTHYQNKNTLAMAKVAGKICDKFSGVLTEFDNIRNSLKRVDKHLDDLETKFKGKDSFVYNVEKLIELGASNNKPIPKAWQELDNYNSNNHINQKKGE